MKRLLEVVLASVTAAATSILNDYSPAMVGLLGLALSTNILGAVHAVRSGEGLKSTKILLGWTRMLVYIVVVFFTALTLKGVNNVVLPVILGVACSYELGLMLKVLTELKVINPALKNKLLKKLDHASDHTKA